MNVKRCISICYEIQDRLNAIKNELLHNEKPYSGYLLEKIKTLEIDVPCLKSEFDQLAKEEKKNAN